MASNVREDSRELFDLMRRFRGGFGRQMDRVLKQNEVNAPQYLAIVALSKSGEAMMGKLAKDLHVTMGAATNIVDKLIRGGYALRERGEDDRRIVRVKLTSKADATLKEIEDEATALMTAALGSLAESRRREFMETFAQLVSAAEAGDAGK